MGFDFVEQTIREMFNEQETIRDKIYFVEELTRMVRELESELQVIQEINIF